MNACQRLLGLGLGLAIAAGASAADMGTAFTYQGFLEDGGGPVTNTSPGCDFEFELWDALAATPAEMLSWTRQRSVFGIGNGLEGVHDVADVGEADNLDTYAGVLKAHFRPK